MKFQIAVPPIQHPPDELSHILAYLPQQTADAIRAYLAYERMSGAHVNEIRIRRGCLSLTLDGRNVRLPAATTREELEGAVKRLCEGSLYPHYATIREGYISVRGGYRVGVVGRAVTVDGRIESVSDIDALNIRIPHAVPGAGRRIAELFRTMGMQRGILLYAGCGVGKTTVLRDLAQTLSSGSRPMRCAVIDTRFEICPDDPGEGMLLDVLRGYPRAKGIEIATRTMSPEVILCDEIGSDAESRAILDVQNTGIPLIATIHATGYAQLMERAAVQTLHARHVFGAYVGLTRAPGAHDYTYTIHQENGAELSVGGQAVDDTPRRCCAEERGEAHVLS